jgi:hypothetical protein
VESGNPEAVGGFGLVPAAFFQHVGDDAPFALFDDLEQGSVGAVSMRAKRVPRPVRFSGSRSGDQGRAGGQHHRALDHVFQFAHIALPVVIHQRTQRFRRQVQRMPAILLRELHDEVFGQQRNVVLALAQRRQVDGDDIQPVEQVFAELAFLSHAA